MTNTLPPTKSSEPGRNTDDSVATAPLPSPAAASKGMAQRDRRGADAVRYGLLAGAWPLVAGLIVARIAPSCAGAPLVSVCTAVCLGVGLPSGGWLGRRLARRAAPTSTWLAASGIALLAASLGCAGLGLTGLLAAAVGLVLGAASASALSRATT
ncbi:hypothetical protein WMF45_34550 [Sorangium sp. So ce448]|uniref:hypothetical protein n=1 Tax=Sorangium sp. So ce448 TaxID=3133314 RepID=UPI003F5DAD1D